MTDDNARTYNGWANYPTWNIALWINNDQGWQESVHDALRPIHDAGAALAGIPQDDDWNTPERMARVRARQAGALIRESVETVIHGDQREANAGVAADLIGWALDSADWAELGASFLADLDEQ